MQLQSNQLSYLLKFTILSNTLYPLQFPIELQLNLKSKELNKVKFPIPSPTPEAPSSAIEL